MTLKKYFCSSPWIHMRINNTGSFEPCRWMNKKQLESRVDFDSNIKNITARKYFQNGMSKLRMQLLAGESPEMCQDCVIMEQHGKPSGRQRQLLKAGIMMEYFEPSLATATLRPAFDYSHQHQGSTDRVPQDWQIDLGNYCNGACVFCNAESSSTLATEFKKLGLISNVPPPSWCDDDELLQTFIQDLIHNPNIQYLHFLGGETVITPGFKKILLALIDAGLAGEITIGFTTNLNAWSDSVVEALTQFKNVNLGMSIETLTEINDYVRYPSQLERTCKLLHQWTNLGHQRGWLMQLRITPSCLTVHDIDTVYDYAWQNKLSVESCNFLSSPEFLKINVLPVDVRQQIAQRIGHWIETHPDNSQEAVINTRNPETIHSQIVQDAKSYLNYVESAQDESHRLPDLVDYLKLLESNRGNSILTYLPQYEKLFRSAGY